MFDWSPPIQDDSKGVIVGCNRNHEWLLPWWWMNFRLHNTLPVTFMNFGDMSLAALEWCRVRGNVIKFDIPDHFVAEKEKVDPLLAKTWESMNTSVWALRKGWFKKPFALLKTPYQKTIWLDLDCQVRGSIEPLFNYLNQADIALVPEVELDQKLNRERGLLLPGEIMYNAGVIVFKHGSKVIQEWGKQAIEQNHLFFGDQQLLIRILFSQHIPVEPIPILYNWPMPYGINTNAIIMHWWGAQKANILMQIGHLKKFFCIDLTLPPQG